MNLTEKLALDFGAKIGEPFVATSFLPIKEDKFILIDTRTKYPSGNYDHFGDVIEMVRPQLLKNNISIFHLSNESDLAFKSDRRFIGINKKQEGYLIKKSELVIANDNYSLYLASVFKKKSIGLYSSFLPSNTRPIWNTDLQTILESDRDGNLPSYGRSSETPKTVNYISPYKLANCILNSLGIENSFGDYELIHMGTKYGQKIVEIVPDFVSAPDFLAGQTINLRFDCIQKLDQKVFNYWMENRKSNIITEKDVNLKLLSLFKQNIIGITVLISDQISEGFLRGCKSLGVPLKIFCNKKEKIADFRFKFFDFDIQEDFPVSDDFLSTKGLTKESKFVSSKILVSKGKKFSCKSNYLLDKALDEQEECVSLSSLFAEEADYYKVYNKISQ